MSSPTPSKGSLEDLFRHHLLESEAAAVPPRPHVWEQLDNSLLLAQNEKYRRRLLVHRWAVAASLLLAMLASGGWWHSQQQSTGSSLAQATPTGANALGAAGQGAARSSYAAGMQATAPTPQRRAYQTLAATTAATGRAFSSSSTSTAPAIDQTATSFTTANVAFSASQRHQVLANAQRHHRAGFGRLARQTGITGAYPIAGQPNAATSEGIQPAGEAAEIAATTQAAQHHAGSLAATSTKALFAQARGLAATTDEMPARTGTFTTQALASQPVPATVNELATRPVELALANGPSLPNSLGALPEPKLPTPTLARRWQFGVGYAASAFQPNIDFTKPTAAYNSALGLASASVTQSAAAEYRSHLRAGLGQRLSLWATRRLGNGRFGLRTGLELAQNMAYSASSVAFVGEQVADLGYLNYAPGAATPASLHTTTYRYRTASVPVELRYSNPAKSGFSFYSRIGGLLTALLNVRSDVEGSPEATRTYSLMSASSPYRSLSGSVRGGVGLQYRPTDRQWALSLGPVAEAGILSLNNSPMQDFWGQKRAYSFGLEAGVELGRAPRVP